VFFTVCLSRRTDTLLVDEIDILREAVRTTRARRPFVIDAWVVLPDHMHAVWTLPEDDPNFSDRWGAIKARFSKFVRLKYAGDAVSYKPTLRETATAGETGSTGRRVGFQPTKIDRLRAARSPSKVAKQDAGIWQRRFWEHHIRDEADYNAHVRYCRINPVKHGLAARPVDWPYSSIHRDIKLGRVDPEYSGTFGEGAFGEP
jgi:putative transposase